MKTGKHLEIEPCARCKCPAFAIWYEENDNLWHVFCAYNKHVSKYYQSSRNAVDSWNIYQRRLNASILRGSLEIVSKD